MRLVRVCLPLPRLLQHYKLEALFGPLLPAYKKGNFKAFESHILSFSEWYRKKSLFTIMKERTKLLIFRNLYYHW